MCVGVEESPGIENSMSKGSAMMVVVRGGSKKRYEEHGLLQGTKTASVGKA